MNFDILEEIEEITTNTNYIIEIYKNTSIICSGNMKYKINKSAKNIADKNGRYYPKSVGKNNKKANKNKKATHK